jgi:hypothetical protein
MLCRPFSFSAVPRASGPVFIFCASRLIFGGTVGVGSRCHVLRARTRFRRYRGCLFPFSCFVLPDSCSAIRRGSVSVFMFCAPVLVFGGTEDVRSCFHVLRSRTRFRWFRGVGSRFLILRARTRLRRFRGRRVQFSCFARRNSFLAVPGASCPVFLFCAPGLIFASSKVVGSHLLQGRRVPFSCFAPDSFSAVPRASCPDFKICAPGLIFGGAECVGSSFHVLRSRTRFRRYRGRLVLISCFVLSDSFSAVPSASGPVLMFCTPRIIFDGTGGIWSQLHVLRARTRFRWYRGGVGSCFLVLRAQARFQRYRGRRVPFSYFAHPDLFSAVLRASGPVFMFCALVLVFSGTEGVRSRFMFYAPRFIFGGTKGVVSSFQVLCSQTRFWRYWGHLVPISCLARPDKFSVVLRASGLDFMICAPRVFFDGTDGVPSRCHVLRARTRFRRYRGRWVTFSCFARPDSSSAVSRASGPVFIFYVSNSFSTVPGASCTVFLFCAPGLIFGGSKVVGSRFHVLRAGFVFGGTESVMSGFQDLCS